MRETPSCVGIITGAATGIGAAAAAEFARQGAFLALVGRAEDDLGQVAAKVARAGGTAVELAADVRDPEAMAGVAARVLDHWGRVDLLCANAGIADQSHIDDGDPELWRAVVDTNVMGVLSSVRCVVPAMKARGSGHIFITSSTSGREAYVGEPAYIASKWGLVGLGHALRQELSSHGIRVTLIEPGLVATPLTLRNPRLRTLMASSGALSPEDVARTISFAYSQPAHVVVSEITVRPLLETETSFDWE